MLRCAHGGERTGSHDLLQDGMNAVFLEAGYPMAVENSFVMPIQLGADGQLHTRRADLVAIPPGGGPLITADVVSSNSVDSAKRFDNRALNRHGSLWQGAQACRSPCWQ
eukprot:SM000264S09755  [mRNA]  locus=s264:45962:46288:+ [translate_table: standard]